MPRKTDIRQAMMADGMGSRQVSRETPARSDDPFENLAEDYPCRTCGDPADFESGLERCDDQPCEKLIAWNTRTETTDKAANVAGGNDA